MLVCFRWRVCDPSLDLRDLTGYPLIRFRVTFDLSIDVANFPFGPNSFRPAVDNVRVRASY